MSGNKSRREFIRLSLLAAAGIGLAGCDLLFGSDQQPGGQVEEKIPDVTQPASPVEEKKHAEDENGNLIPRRLLGRTGLPLSILGLGGAFTVAQSHLREEAVAIMDRALDLGVNLIDTAPTYGASENNIGEVMRRRRGEIYIAGKTLDRSYDGTMRLFEQSLGRLQTGHLDLYFLHGVHTEKDLKLAMGAGGALSALEELKDEGTVKSTGITSHRNYGVLLKALQEYNFDCVMLALNPAEIVMEPVLVHVIEEAVRREIGIIAMKVPAYGRIFRQGGIESMEQALGYALSHPVSTAVVGISSLAELEENIELAAGFEPLTPAQMSHQEELVRPYRQEITFYKQWS